MRNFRGLAVIAIATLSMIGAGCTKKPAAQITPNPPPQREASTPSTPVASTPEREAAGTPASAPSTPRSNMPDAATRVRIDQLLAKIEDAYFDYDQRTLRPDAIKALEGDSAELRDILKDFPDYKLTIEGHCDERGSAQYNMALGEARAESAKNYLVQVGIPGQQLGVISYGKEKPICQEQDEACWQKNRRIHIVAVAQQH
jgi:peptidoglycan-associated lipoprotein